jgi:hypothetical protein
MFDSVPFCQNAINSKSLSKSDCDHVHRKAGMIYLTSWNRVYVSLTSGYMVMGVEIDCLAGLIKVDEAEAKE